MKLQYIICFDQNITEHARQKLTQDLQTQALLMYSPLNISCIPHLTDSSCLVITDSITGVQFAIQHALPYIEKWDDTINTFSQKPVCYYDNLEHLSSHYLINQWLRYHHLPLTIAKTERLVLRELSLSDIPALYELKADPNVQKHMPKQLTLEEEIEKHKSYITCQYEFFDYGLWGVYLNDNTLIGQAGIQNTEYQNATFPELSYLIAPKYQRKGYASETILAIYHYVQESLEQNSILSIIAKSNLPSIRTAMNLGMKRYEEVLHYGFDCNYYVLDDISTFLACYLSEQKRIIAAKSALQNARKHPVQQVYSRYRK